MAWRRVMEVAQALAAMAVRRIPVAVWSAAAGPVGLLARWVPSSVRAEAMAMEAPVVVVVALSPAALLTPLQVVSVRAREAAEAVEVPTHLPVTLPLMVRLVVAVVVGMAAEEEAAAVAVEAALAAPTPRGPMQVRRRPVAAMARLW